MRLPYGERVNAMMTRACCALFLAGLMACDAEVGGGTTGGTDRPDGGSGSPPVSGLPDASTTASGVRFKGGARLRADLARALGLAPTDVCRELGRYDCATEVHNIVLGGVEPYVLGITRPLPEAPVTAPLAIDRVALAACLRAVERDLADRDAAVIFRAGPDGTWTATDRRAALTRLIERTLIRRATDAEIDRLEPLWTEAADPAEWAVTACFVVTSSVESLFY